MIDHVRGDLLDDLPRCRLIQAEPASEPIEPPHHVLDGGSLYGGSAILTHVPSGYEGGLKMAASTAPGGNGF